MPLSTLVGAFSNSVGLCSTGQVHGAIHPQNVEMREMTRSTVRATRVNSSFFSKEYVEGPVPIDIR